MIGFLEEAELAGEVPGDEPALSRSTTVARARATR
jgi:hypothetical protein